MLEFWNVGELESFHHESAVLFLSGDFGGHWNKESESTRHRQNPILDRKPPQFRIGS